MDSVKFSPLSINILGRMLKGIMLVAWICILVLLAILAANGKSTKAIEEIENKIVQFFNPSYFKEPISDIYPSSILRWYLSHQKQPPPPLESLLDLIVKDPPWVDRDIASTFRKPGVKEEYYDVRRAEYVQEQCNALFSKVDSILRAIVSDRSLDPKSLYINIPEVPQVFKDRAGAKQETKIVLPQVLASWVVEQRVREDNQKQRDALVDTFLILIVLGAFGSLIFLTKDYIECDVETTLAAYFFRPILGMFLALAIFVIDMVAHSLISTADILKIRHETLYILALAAGLLSDQAYTVVSIRAQAALEKWKEKSAVSETQDKLVEPPK